MPLTTQEQVVRIGRLGGQAGRSPIASLSPGQASHSDGAFHHADFLAPAKGTKKLVTRPMPASGYELRGEATGILEIPAIEGYEAAWISDPAAQNRSWGIQFGIKPLDPGRITESADDGQIFFSTGAQIGVDPAGGSDINTIRASFVVEAGVYTVRVRWGLLTFDVPLIDSGDASAYDMADWMSMAFYCLNGTPTATLHFQVTQEKTGGVRQVTALNEVQAQGWVVHGLYLGGALPSRRPIQGIYRPCPCVVTEVVLRADTATNGATVSNQSTPWARASAFATSATAVTDIWPLDDSTTRPDSLGGRTALMVGNRVHRGTGISTEQSGSLECDGTGMVTVQDAERLRETPKTRAQGGVEGHFLELTERTIAVLIDPRRIPWREQSIERACFLCESTPYATNLGGGVATDPELGTYSDNIRPSEHVRAEIEHVGTDWMLHVYFGELEPESLKHPTGTAGGQTTTAWPPALSTAGEPPATWNKPQDDPTAAHGAADGKTAFEINLGDDVDATHPMNYAWWIFLQRKFVAQSSGSNACSVWVRRVTSAGALDTGFAEASDAQSDSGERHPANQSCFSVARLNGTDVCFRPDSYVLTLGGDGGSQFGEEQMSYDGSTKPAQMYPVDDVLARCEFSDEGDRFPFRGKIGSFAVFKKYLLENDRERIAVAGGVTPAIRLAFGDDLIMSLNFEEAAGNVLRDGRGNDIAYAEKIGLAAIINDQNHEQPQLVGAYPRAAPPWHNECDQFEGEYGAVGAIVQRFNSGLTEELYAIARAGLYQYDRDTHALTRVATLPGQGGSGQTCAVVDNADIIHVAGGPGRPVVITREQAVAISGLDTPFYAAPQQVIYANKAMTGGLSITFQTTSSQLLTALVGYEIDDAATMAFSVGYWSDALRTRSRPGNPIVVRYVDAQFNAPVVTSPPTIIRYRIMISGLPPPRGPNANLISHWEIYRTDANGRVLILEKRIPISSQPVAVMVGDIPLGTAESADVFRDVPPEGLKALVVYGDRLVGVAPPESPRSVVWTKRRDSMNWPPIYSANLNQTNAPATGCIVRRGRAFPFSRDHFYQLLESTLDADLIAGQVESLSLDTLAEGVGGISHFAAITDHENGVYIAGNKSVYLTEGGTYRSISKENDSSGAAGGDDFSWPDSWELEDPQRFTSFHDERRRMVAICGPAKDDSNRIDALLLFYERAQIAADGRSFMADPDCGRLVGIDATCSASVLDPPTGNREVWLGTQLGYLVLFGEFGSAGVDYDWLDDVGDKVGTVMSTASDTNLRIEGSFGTEVPAADLFRGATLRIYRGSVLVSMRRVIGTVVADSWADLELDGDHDAIAGDFFTVGAIPLDWRSGKLDGGETLTDKRLHSVDITMNE